MIGCKKDSEQKVNQDTTVTNNVTNLKNNTVVSDTSKTKPDTTKINSDTNKTKQANLGLEYTSRYICPMHCKGSGSDKPGTCPVCGMEYVENPDYQKK